VLVQFHTLVDRCDYLVAYNLYFDEKIILAEFLRNHLSNNFLGRKRICTMRGAVEYCALPGPYGYKWPKLIDLHKRLFGTGFSHAHDRSEEHTSELQSRENLVCRLLLEKKKTR